jgi:hypothetical protein
VKLLNKRLSNEIENERKDYDMTKKQKLMKVDNLQFNLIETSELPFMNKVIHKGNFDGYILYRKQNSKWKWYPIMNFKDVYKIKDKKLSYILYNIIGYMEDGKPFMMIDENIPINLNIASKSTITDENNNPMYNGIDLCYDSKAFYIYLEYATLKNLTPKSESSSDFWNMIKEYWWVALIFIGIMLLLFLTPQGKEFISKLMPQNANGLIKR